MIEEIRSESACLKDWQHRAVSQWPAGQTLTIANPFMKQALLNADIAPCARPATQNTLQDLQGHFR